MAFEIRVKGAALADQLATARSIIDRKKTLPVLAHALLEVQSGQLRIAATDLNVTFKGRCEDTVGAGKGETTADVETLYSLAKSLGEETVTLTAKDNEHKLHVTAEGFKAALPSLDPRDFPAWPEAPAGVPVVLPRAELKYALDLTRFAMSTDDKRFFMHGVLLDLGPESHAVGTDGHRVCIKGLPTVKPSEQIKAVVPAKSVSALVTMLDGAGPDAQFTPGESHLFFTIGNHEIATRVVEGNFPPYDSIAKQAGKDGQSCTFDRVALLSAVRRLLLMSDTTRRSVTLGFESGRVRLAARSQESGEAEQWVGCTYEGAPCVVACSAPYLQDFLDASAEDQVSVALGVTEAATMLWRAGDTYRYVLAPMSL